MMLGIMAFILGPVNFRRLMGSRVITSRATEGIFQVHHSYLTAYISFRHVWCLDFKGGLFCTTLPETGLSWQRFDNSVHQVAVSPSGRV